MIQYDKCCMDIWTKNKGSTEKVGVNASKGVRKASHWRLEVGFEE